MTNEDTKLSLAAPVVLTEAELEQVGAGGYFSFANAEAYAEAYGKIAKAWTVTSTFTAPGYAAAYSESTSISAG